MYFDIQKASFWKRLSAFVLDGIFLVILATLLLWLLSLATGYDTQSKKLEATYSRYEEAYGIDFEIDEKTYLSFTEEEKAAYDAAYGALLGDAEAMATYRKVVNLTLLTTTLGIFFAFLILEFIVPLFLGDGRTIGKKIFGICLMRRGQTKVTHLPLFIRTILGKFAVETMVPVLTVIMLYFNSLGGTGLLAIIVLALAQVIVFISSKGSFLLHDLLGDTLVVDYLSQKIFQNEEEKLEWKKQLAQERAMRADY